MVPIYHRGRKQITSTDSSWFVVQGHDGCALADGAQQIPETLIWDLNNEMFGNATLRKLGLY